MREPSNIRLLTVDFVATQILGLGKPRLYSLIRSNFFPRGVVIKFGERQIRFNHEKLIQWLETGGSIDDLEKRPLEAGNQ